VTLAKRLLAGSAVLVAALVLAIVSWSLIEKPILAFRDRPARRAVSLAPV